MRGKKSGLESKLREKQPNLLDVDGDICHHVHNAVKKFCWPFKKFVEKLVDILYTDSKWSLDVHKAIEEMYMILDIPYKKPPQRISHRWVSAYDCTVPLVTQLGVYYLFYFAWLDKDLSVYNEDFTLICDGHKTNDTGKKRVGEIQNVFAKKSLTNDGKDRKARIVEKMISQNMKLHLISNFYRCASVVQVNDFGFRTKSTTSA